MVRKPLPEEALVALRQRFELRSTTRAERKQLVQETSALYGVSTATVYRALRLPEVLTFFGLHREFRNAGYFETEQAQRIALALKPAIEAGHLIALTGITGCGKTTTARRIRQDLDKERKILVATNLAVDKERVKLSTLMEAIYADIGTDKEAMLPTQAELRERRLRDLIQRRGRPVALFIDEAHDLHPKTMVGLKRLVEVVQEVGAVLAIVLVGLPRLRVNLRRPAMEEIGARVTMLTLESLQGSGLPFLTWLLERCKRSEVALTDIFTEEAMTMLVDRLTTPLQLIHYAWRALEEAYVAGQKPVDAETVHDVLVPDLDGLEPRLMRLGYPVKSLCEALNARPAEIRAFLRGRLAPGRMQELHQELLKLGVAACKANPLGLQTRAFMDQHSMRIGQSAGQHSVQTSQHSYANGLQTRLRANHQCEWHNHREINAFIGTPGFAAV